MPDLTIRLPSTCGTRWAADNVITDAGLPAMRGGTVTLHIDGVTQMSVRFCETLIERLLVDAGAGQIMLRGESVLASVLMRAAAERRGLDSRIVVESPLDARIAQARAEGYAQAVADVRWLAEARAQYAAFRETSNVAEYRALSEPERAVHDEVVHARHVADMLAGDNDAAGWLPSWRWDEWTERRAAPDTVHV